MKIFISTDIEGVTGVCHWDETDIDTKFGRQYSLEVAAACKGAIAAGASEVLVKDAHGSARTIDHSLLPIEASLNRNWSGHPYMMMDGLDESFDAVMMIGYHSGAMKYGNPLAHTMSSSKIQQIKLNGIIMSEFDINTLTAHTLGVPVIFLTGDSALCEGAIASHKGLNCVATGTGKGDSNTYIHPAKSIELIEEGAKKAIQSIEDAKSDISLPNKFDYELRFGKQKLAYKASFYPDAKLVDPHTVAISCDKHYDFLRALMFMLQ